MSIRKSLLDLYKDLVPNQNLKFSKLVSDIEVVVGTTREDTSDEDIRRVMVRVGLKSPLDMTIRH